MSDQTRIFDGWLARDSRDRDINRHKIAQSIFICTASYFTMVAKNKRKGPSESVYSPTMVVVTTGDDWAPCRAKLSALKSMVEEEDHDLHQWSSVLPRDETTRLWQTTEQSMLEEAATLQSRLSEEIKAAAKAHQLESNAQYEAHMTVISLTAERDSLMMDINDADQQIQSLRDDIARNEELTKASREEADVLYHQQEEDIHRDKYMISFYARCTGISWDYDKTDRLAGIVVRGSFHTFNGSMLRHF